LVRALVSSGGRGVAEQVEDDLLQKPLNSVDELKALCERLEKEPLFKKQLVGASANYKIF